MTGNVASTPHLRRIGSFVTVGAIVAILFETLLPESGHPFGSHLCLVCGELGGVDSLLNVLLFAPLGVGLALRGINRNWSILMACAVSVAVETAQLLFVPGRDATLGDVVTNTLGAALGFALARHAGSWLRPAPRLAAMLGLAWCLLWLGIQAASNFSFTPSIPDSTDFGQIARELGDFDVFPGRVIRASIGDVAVLDAQLAAHDSIAHRLLGGATVSATVIPGGLTTGIAPIVRVADAGQREIVLLGQQESRLVFGVRTGAAILRLRPPLFALPGVFPTSTAAPDTLVLSGRYLQREVTLGAQTGSEIRRTAIAPSAALGWTLVLPGQWLIEGTRAERTMSLAWLALLVLPLGYWAAWLSGTGARQPEKFARTVFLVWTLYLAVLAAGLGLVPIAFGLPPARLGALLAVLVGMLLGAALPRLVGTGPGNG